MEKQNIQNNLIITGTEMDAADDIRKNDGGRIILEFQYKKSSDDGARKT